MEYRSHRHEVSTRQRATGQCWSSSSRGGKIRGTTQKEGAQWDVWNTSVVGEQRQGEEKVRFIFEVLARAKSFKTKVTWIKFEAYHPACVVFLLGRHFVLRAKLTIFQSYTVHTRLP